MAQEVVPAADAAAAVVAAAFAAEQLEQSVAQAEPQRPRPSLPLALVVGAAWHASSLLAFSFLLAVAFPFRAPRQESATTAKWS